jgi:hypothetical protein
MNIGLLIRGAKAGAKLAGKAAKATGRGAKAGAKATGAKAKSAAKAVGKTKVARGAKRVGGKVVENVGYAATPGLRRAKTAAGATRYFKKAKGTGPIKSIAKAKVKRTGKQVVGGAAAIGSGYGGTKTVKSRRAAAAKAKAAREAAAAKGRAAVKPKAAPAKPAKPASKAAPASKPKPAPKPRVVAPKPKAAPAKKRVSRFDAMSKKKLKGLTGKNKLMYRRYLREGGKNKV